MPIPNVIGDLSTTASSNGPAGTETPTDGDGYLRAHAGFIAELRDKLNGTSDTGTIKNATFSGTMAGAATWSGLQTFAGGIAGTFSSGISSTTGAFSGLVAAAVGLTVGNSAQAGATTLDWYEEGSFTPGITFGGAAVGVTYNANRGGSFTRIGNRVFFEARLRLSSKGSSTGSASITGLPYTFSSSGNVTESPCAADYSGLTGLTGALFGAPTSGATSIGLYQTDAAATVPVTDANFTNSADVYVSGHYRV